MKTIILLVLLLFFLLKTTNGLRVVEVKYFTSTPTSNCSVHRSTAMYPENACASNPDDIFAQYIYSCNEIKESSRIGYPNNNCSSPISSYSLTNGCRAPTTSPAVGYQISCVDVKNVVVPTKCGYSENNLLYQYSGLSGSVIKIGSCQLFNDMIGLEIHNSYYAEVVYVPEYNEQVVKLDYYSDSSCQTKINSILNFVTLNVCDGINIYTYHGGSVAMAKLSTILVFGYFIFTFSFIN